MMSIIRPHRSTMYVDVAYCYWPSSVICRTVCRSVTVVSPAKNGRTIEMPFELRTRMGSRNRVLDEGPDAHNLLRCLWRFSVIRSSQHCCRNLQGPQSSDSNQSKSITRQPSSSLHPPRWLLDTGYCHSQQSNHNYSKDVFYNINRMQAAEIDLYLQTRPSKGPNMPSVWICHLSAERFPRHLQQTPVFCPWRTWPWPSNSSEWGTKHVFRVHNPVSFCQDKLQCLKSIKNLLAVLTWHTHTLTHTNSHTHTRVVVWRSGNGTGCINKVTPCRAQLLLGWVTVCSRQATLLFHQAAQADSASYTQWDMKWAMAKVQWCAVGVKTDLYCSFYSIPSEGAQRCTCGWQVKLCDPSLTCAILRDESDWE